MSLRCHFYLSVLLALLAGLVGGTSIAYLQARRSVQHEMDRALDTTANIVRTVFKESDLRTAGSLPQLVHGFDGDRHVRVQLQFGHAEYRSEPAPAEKVPNWFVRLLAIPAQQREVRLAPRFIVAVTTNPHNEISESWGQLQDAVLVLLGSGGLILLLSACGFYWAARPYHELIGAFKRLGSGDYEAFVAARGPTELQELARSFNAMAARLREFESATRRLHGQLLSIEEEERAEIARNLHDELGPLLFSIKRTTEKLLADTEPQSISRRLVGVLLGLNDQINLQVRQILGRLRSEEDQPQDLSATLENLSNFWRLHHPELSIHINVPKVIGSLPAKVAEAASHILQEALTNAVRHSAATDVWLTVSCDHQNVCIRIEDNGAGMINDMPNIAYGLRGMRERVEAIGGSLSFGKRDPHGVRIDASIKCEVEFR